MRVFITGATGFLGRRVAGALVAWGDAVLALTRARARATAAGLDDLAGPGVLTVLEGDPVAPESWQEALAGCDAVVALAGERVFGPRLTPAYKARVERSRIGAVQPAAYNALEIAMREGLRDEESLYALGISEEVPTVQAKLQHGVPPDALYALEALRASDGLAVSVTDAEALAAQRDLAREGVFGEPSAAAALAGVRRLVQRGAVQPDHTVVALVTGSGFREVASSAGVTRRALTEATLLDAVA